MVTGLFINLNPVGASEVVCHHWCFVKHYGWREITCTNDMDYDSDVTTVVKCLCAKVWECVKEFAPILELCEAWCQVWGSDKCIVCIGTPMPSFSQPMLTTFSGGVFPRVSLARARHIEPPIWTVAVTRWLNLKVVGTGGWLNMFG